MNNSNLVWLFQTGEPLHIDSDDSRPMRAMNLANALVEHGHQVVLWSTDFYHQKKRHRYNSYKAIKVSDKLEIRLIPSRGYVRNIGFDRLLDHAQLALNLKRALKKEQERPCVAFVGYPPIEFASVATTWLMRNKIPVLLDAKDQWPDIFIEPFPNLLKPLARIVFYPYFYMGRKVMCQATGLSSMANGFLKWMRDFSGRGVGKFDGVFPLSPIDQPLSSKTMADAIVWWREKGVVEDGRPRFLFVGSFSQAFDFDTIRKVAALAMSQGLDWQFVLCGAGAMSSEVSELFSGLANVVLPGWVDRPKVVAISKLSLAGLAPYRNIPNFQHNIPNKVIDYLSLKLPVISPLDGEVNGMIENHEIGLKYVEGSADSLFLCLRSLAEDYEMAAFLSGNAATIYKQQFSGEKVYESLVLHLRGMANGD